MPAPDPADLALLGLGPRATLGDVHRAWERIQQTWSPDSLATYGLLEDAEREEILARLTAAHRRILAAFGTAPPGGPAVPWEPAEDVPIVLEPDAEHEPGPYLRHHRTSRGLELEAIERVTRIRPALLEALEEGDASRLPEPVFVRGFVIAYARALGLPDPEALARSYLAWLEGRGPAGFPGRG